MTHTVLSTTAPWPKFTPTEQTTPKSANWVPRRRPKVTPQQAQDIRAMLAKGTMRKIICKQYDIDFSTQLRQQSDLVETCVEAMNANADASQKAEQENQRLRGEAGVMRGLLTECAGIILAIDNESEDESDRLDDLHEKIVLAIRGAE